MKQIIPWITVAVLVVVGYLFKDKLFTGGAVPSIPVCETPLLKSSIVIQTINNGRVDFKVVLEAKKDVDIIALRAFYFDKTKRREYSGVGNSKRTTLDSDEMGNIDLSDGKIELKAGEQIDVEAYFEADKTRDSHYIEITGNISPACPAEMEVLDCIEMQRQAAEKDPKGSKLYIIQRIMETQKK